VRQETGLAGLWQAQVLGQPRPGGAASGTRDVLRRFRRDDVLAVRAAARAHVDEVVGGGDQVQVVVDDDDRGPGTSSRSNTPASAATSSGCRPVDGSSKTYSAPRWLLRSREAIRSRCDSPPDRDGVGSASRR
jgi:hypothetical protein